MGELFGDACFGVRVAEVFPVQGELVLVIAVVGEREHVAFAEQVMPVERRVEIGVAVGLVGDALSVGQRSLPRAFGQPFLTVDGVHAVERPAQAEPVRIAVTQGDIVPFGLDPSVVLVESEVHAAHVVQSATDVILRVAVDEASLHVQSVLAEPWSVAEVEVDIVAFFGTQVRPSGFQVFVAEKFVGRGQAVSFLV